MTGPAIQQRDSRGYVQMPGGYDAAVQQAGQPQAQQQTQLGQPVQQPAQGQIFTQESMSPLAQQAPRLPWDRPAPAPQPQQVQQQQVQQPSPQQAAQQMQFPAGADLNARVSGANIPPELQGRTIGEIIGIANGLRQVHLQSLQQPGQMPGQMQQQPIQQQQAQPNQPAAFDWKNPQESIARVVGGELDKFRQQLAPVFAPLIQQNARQGIEAARNAVAAEIPNYAQIEPLVLQRLQGIDQASLSNPETWRIAARVAIGDLALQGGRQQQVQQQPGMYPVQQVGFGQNPSPNLNSFFTETPMQGGAQNAPVQLTSQELQAAQAMNMNPADYFAWKGGTPNGQGQIQPGGFRR